MNVTDKLNPDTRISVGEILRDLENYYLSYKG